MKNRDIITVGFCPAWDITCYVKDLNWGEHKQLDRQTTTPAGKALNISRALAWMGVRTTAAGLWGIQDYPALQQELQEPLITLRMTPAEGRTRQNITVADTLSKKEMHLRAPCLLATEASLSQLARDLETVVRPGSLVVFAGSMPAHEHMEQILSIFRRLVTKGAQLAVDTSGPLYCEIVKSVPIAVIKPNLEELGQLCGKTIPDGPAEIVTAARAFCDRVETVIVSRGEQGALLITKDLAWSGQAICTGQSVVQTVGCGDFLLAGFLANPGNRPEEGLAAGVKAATAKVRGMYPAAAWTQAETSIAVCLNQL
jgi:1-phosphofructokinase family hexose kinase